MMSSPIAVAAQFIECREAHRAAGGQSKGLKYSQALRKVAVAHLRSVPSQSIGVVALELGVSITALKRWDDQTPRPRLAGGRPTSAFLPVEVMTTKVEKAPMARAPLVVTCREISVDLGAEIDEALLRIVLSTLQSRHAGVSL